jgi:LysM repeat protein
MAGALCVGTAATTVVACGQGGSRPQAAKQVQKPASVASTSSPLVKAADAAPVVPAAQTQPEPQRYTVAFGDTLWTIAARAYGVGDQYTRILQVNPAIVDPNQIFIGQALIIPDASVPAPAAVPTPVLSAPKVLPSAPASPAPVTQKPVVAAVSAPAPVRAPAVVSSSGAGGIWACIRAHESGGNYATNTGNGYYGAYQFALGTWQSLGGSGLPSNAPAAVQDAMAQKLAARSGMGQWPVTSRMCGA